MKSVVFPRASVDIEMIRTAHFDSERAEEGNLPLRHHKLNDPPRLGTIRDGYSLVLGDPFHTVDRTKVGMHHEHRKGYKVALQIAMFV